MDGLGLENIVDVEQVEAFFNDGTTEEPTSRTPAFEDATATVTGKTSVNISSKSCLS